MGFQQFFRNVIAFQIILDRDGVIVHDQSAQFVVEHFCLQIEDQPARIELGQDSLQPLPAPLEDLLYLGRITVGFLDKGKCIEEYGQGAAQIQDK